MYSWLRDAPIRHKLVTLGLVASACALIVASFVFLVTTYVVARRTTHDNVVVQSAILADNITAALAFGDRSVAADTLRALRATSTIDMACVWTLQGEFFAAYQPTPSLTCPSAMPPDLDRIDAGHIEVARPVVLGGRRLGSLYIRANLNEVATRVRAQAYATLAALLLGAGTAIAFAVGFQRIIAAPITALASTASTISRRGDYSIRAKVAGQDEVGQLIVAFNDMLHQIERRDDELRVANRLKDEFLATLSHELRTPLNAILGWLQILQMTPPTPERLQQALKSLERNARAEARLVEDLLDVSRIVAGKLQLKLGLVDASQVVEAAVDVIRPSADAKGVQIHTHVDRPPHIVKGDADRLQQAVWNLLANAVKFSEPSSRVTISLRHTSHEATITVEDNGIGIDAKFLPHIFELFRQADASFTREHPGLGLGLAIVHEIAHAHGGRIDAFSAGVGHGARFVLHLPSAQGEQRLLDVHPEALGADTGLKGVSVLIVDDDADARELAAMALANRDASVTTAPDASSALELASTHDFDVLVADLAMPEVDGYGFLHRLRTGETAKGRTLPAVAVTAQASTGEEARAIAAGFFAYVLKPYRFEDLVQAVGAAVRSRRGLGNGRAHDDSAPTTDR